MQYLKTIEEKIRSNLNFLPVFNKIKSIRLSLISFLLVSLTSNCFSKDILKEQAADAIDTFKGTVLTLIIIAEIIGAYSYWHKSRDLKGTITGLFFVLLLTGWAATKV